MILRYLAPVLVGLSMTIGSYAAPRIRVDFVAINAIRSSRMVFSHLSLSIADASGREWSSYVFDHTTESLTLPPDTTVALEKLETDRKYFCTINYRVAGDTTRYWATSIVVLNYTDTLLVVSGEWRVENGKPSISKMMLTIHRPAESCGLSLQTMKEKTRSGRPVFRLLNEGDVTYHTVNRNIGIYGMTEVKSGALWQPAFLQESSTPIPSKPLDIKNGYYAFINDIDENNNSIPSGTHRFVVNLQTPEMSQQQHTGLCHPALKVNFELRVLTRVVSEEW